MELEIEAYFHCKKCLEEKPADVTPQEWSKVQAGWTKKGLQVWCFRHELNIINLDFEGKKVKAA
jgi:hypothetical protein